MGNPDSLRFVADKMLGSLARKLRLLGIDTAYISGRFPGLPIIGFFGNAEIAPLHGSNHLFSHTGVLALITEA